METKKGKIYERLPLIYGYLMRKISYEAWAEYIALAVDEFVSSSERVLELGAGNCGLANYLCKFYPNIIATDLSKNMLVSDNKNIIPKIACDMALLPFKIQFGLIYSTFDSVNYLTSKRKLFELFKQASCLLKEEGVFTFDVSLERNSISHAGRAERKGTYKGINFVQRSCYNTITRIHTNYFELSSKGSIIYTENHRQKIYPFETYFDLIEKAGMYVVKCYDAFSFNKGKSNSRRVQFIIRRNKNYA